MIPDPDAEAIAETFRLLMERIRRVEEDNLTVARKATEGFAAIAGTLQSILDRVTYLEERELARRPRL